MAVNLDRAESEMELAQGACDVLARRLQDHKEGHRHLCLQGAAEARRRWKHYKAARAQVRKAALHLQYAEGILRNNNQ